jgi:hypothetical protein
MSLADPQSITIAPASALSLPRVSVGDDESEYASGDGLTSLRAAHQYGKRTRRVIRVDTSKITADPFKPSENVRVSSGVQLVFDIPPAGYTAAEMLAVFVGFNTLLTATSNAVVVKLLGGES